MGKFITKLDVELDEHEPDDNGGVWMLNKPLTYVADDGMSITVPAGFITDFASVPRVPFIFEVFGNSVHEAATLHDWLYHDHPVTRRVADKLFLEAMRSTRITKWKARAIYLAVRLFGAAHW